MRYRYAGVIAINPNTDRAEVVKSATGTVHINEDWGTPVVVQDPNGFDMTTLNTTVEGLFPDFYVDDHPVVGFQTNSGHRFYLRSSTPVPGPPGALPVTVRAIDGNLSFEYPGGNAVPGPALPVPSALADEEIAGLVQNDTTVTGAALASTFANRSASTTSSHADGATRQIIKGGTLIDPASSVSPWNQFILNGVTIAAATTPDPEVGRFLTLTPGPTGSRNRIARTVQLDLSNGFLSVPVRVNGTGLTSFQGLFGTRTTNLSQSIEVGGANVNSTNLVPGRWNTLTIELSEAFRPNAPYADDNDVKHMGFYWNTNDGTTTVDIGQIRYHPRANMTRKIVWQFDDGRKDTYTTTYPILKAAGYVGSIPVEVDTIGRSDRMTLAELQEVYDAGWEICHHHGQQIPPMTDAAAETEFQKMVDLADTNGWSRGRQFFIWPGGIWDTAKETIALKYFKYLRRVSPLMPGPTPWITNKYSISPYYVTTDTTLANAKSNIDKIAQRGGVLLFVTHSIKENPTSSDWGLTNFQEVVNYARSLGIESTTLQEMYESSL